MTASRVWIYESLGKIYKPGLERGLGVETLRQGQQEDALLKRVMRGLACAGAVVGVVGILACSFGPAPGGANCEDDGMRAPTQNAKGLADDCGDDD